MSNIINPKYLSLPEQVEKNKKDIELLKANEYILFNSNDEIAEGIKTISRDTTNFNPDQLGNWELVDIVGTFFKINGYDDSDLFITFLYTTKGPRKMPKLEIFPSFNEENNIWEYKLDFFINGDINPIIKKWLADNNLLQNSREVLNLKILGNQNTEAVPIYGYIEVIDTQYPQNYNLSNNNFLLIRTGGDGDNNYKLNLFYNDGGMIYAMNIQATVADQKVVYFAQCTNKKNYNKLYIVADLPE